MTQEEKVKRYDEALEITKEINNEHKFKVGDEIETANEESLTITKIDDEGYWSGDLFICNFNEECCWDLVEPKPVWSEEDEGYLNALIKYFSQIEGLGNTKEDIIIWLKSLKQRIGE